jgi:hypothetical protein
VVAVFNATLHVPDSPTSVGRYTLELDESSSTFTLITQVLTDNPRERDWRSEYFRLAGSYVRSGESLAFRIEQSQRGVRSSAWQGRVDDSRPCDSFVGTQHGDQLTIDVQGVLVLTRGEAPRARAALIIPDYAFE